MKVDTLDKRAVSLKSDDDEGEMDEKFGGLGVGNGSNTEERAGYHRNYSRLCQVSGGFGDEDKKEPSQAIVNIFGEHDPLVKNDNGEGYTDERVRDERLQNNGEIDSEAGPRTTGTNSVTRENL